MSRHRVGLCGRAGVLQGWGLLQVGRSPFLLPPPATPGGHAAGDTVGTLRALGSAGRGLGTAQVRAPPAASPRRGGLCATHPGDTVTIETAALQRVENGEIRQGRDVRGGGQQHCPAAHPLPVPVSPNVPPQCPSASPGGGLGTHAASPTGTQTPASFVCQTHHVLFVSFQVLCKYLGF